MSLISPCLFLLNCRGVLSLPETKWPECDVYLKLQCSVNLSHSGTAKDHWTTRLWSCGVPKKGPDPQWPPPRSVALPCGRCLGKVLFFIGMQSQHSKAVLFQSQHALSQGHSAIIPHYLTLIQRYIQKVNNGYYIGPARFSFALVYRIWAPPGALQEKHKSPHTPIKKAAFWDGKKMKQI